MTINRRDSLTSNPAGAGKESRLNAVAAGYLPSRAAP
jgi:hypothetical protein